MSTNLLEKQETFKDIVQLAYEKGNNDNNITLLELIEEIKKNLKVLY